nr:uncharacterized protein LOC104108571 isoform X1 [Nicotiana tomentosiformis]XP_018630497.1 uncharacterized protein LOC104108571 isoform X1 [Nicotiana tomentosiformis]XP_018630498.1 uncharacterized protein LOC104108571 isoform X1 [Nicotiana tomentosiformis]
MLIVCCFLPHIHCDAHPLRDKCCTSTKVLGLVGWYDSNEGYWQDSYLRRFEKLQLLEEHLQHRTPIAVTKKWILSNESLEEFIQNQSIDDNYGILVTSDVKSLKSQINSLLASGAFSVPRSPASDDN